MRSPRQLTWLACCVCLASALIATSAGASEASVYHNRFGRALLAYEGATPSYLLPTQLPQLCHGSNCCQEDDYTSAYQVMMLNSSRAVYGGRTYTTFFMNLQRSLMCDTDVDKMGCCNANVSTVWIDVDPELKVVHTTLNSQRWADSTQDMNGFRLGITPEQYLVLPPSTLMSITVSGAVEQLCPIADIAPIPGLCEVILEGGTPGNPSACCPRGVSRPSSISNWVPPTSFTCVADQAVSPFNMAQAYVSNMYIGADGIEYVDYALNLTQNIGCREGPNSCCGMHLSNLELKVLASTQVTGVTINSVTRKHTLSDWNDMENDAAQYKVLSVEGLEWPVEDVPRSGNLIVITVKIPSEATAVPQLCAPETKPGLFGSCNFFMYSSDGFCCPSGGTNPVTGPIIATACNPTVAVPVETTSFGFMYYEYQATTTASEFTFVVTSNGAPDCGQANCVEVCGWELAVNDALIPQITYSSDNAANSASSLVQRGPDAAIIFSFATSADQSQYTIRTPVGTPLDQLCRANSHIDQGNYACAATIRSGSVYAMAFFSQDQLVIKTYPDICPVSKPLSDSCLRPAAARFNWAENTILDFALARLDSSSAAGAGCENVAGLKFEVIMFPGPVGSLVSSHAVDPRDGVSYNMTSGVTWSSTPSAANSVKNFGFKLDGVRDISQVCIQNLLPNQPQDTCMVQLKNADSCFTGFVTPVRDPSLIWNPDYGEGKAPSRAAVVVPAVVVPVAVLAAVALAALLFVRRRRAAAYRPANEPMSEDAADDMRAPLVQSSEPSMASAAASDVQVQLPRGERQTE